MCIRDSDNSYRILASDGNASDEFGKSVAINGNYALVGAWGNDEGGSLAGSAYLYKFKFDKEYAVKFEFPEKKTVTKYDVLLTDPSNLSIREWELRGCDNSGTYNRADASTYTVLDARIVDNSTEYLLAGAGALGGTGGLDGSASGYSQSINTNDRLFN